MAIRRSGRALLAVAAGVFLTTMSGGAAVASYQARIPELMARKHIPGLALAPVDGDHVVWQQGFGPYR